MQTALERLPTGPRETLLLVVVGELTHQEAADLQGVPPGAERRAGLVATAPPPAAGGREPAAAAAAATTAGSKPEQLVAHEPGGDRPPAARGRLRAEEILAAMPPPASLTAAGAPLRLGIHGVRSWRAINEKPSVLVEVAAHAIGEGEQPARDEPRAICFVLDQSAAGDGLTWPRICRGLAAAAGQFSAADRVTVILCGQRPRVALDQAAPARLAALAADLEWLPAAAAADLNAGLRLVEEEAGASRTTVVSHDGTLDRGRGTLRAALAGWHRHLAQTEGDPSASSGSGGPRVIVLDPTFGRTDCVAATPSPHGCELLLASILGEALGASPHVARRGPPLAVAAAVSTAWQERGDVTAFGATLIRSLEPRPSRSPDRD